MKTFLAAVLLALSCAASGQSPAVQPKVAVLSLLGDRLLVVGGQMQTGSNLNRNMKEHVPVRTDELDTAMVLAFEREALRARPKLDVVLLRANDRSVHELQDAVLEGKRDQRELLAAIAPLARRAGATHLVLFTKSRSEAKIQVADGSIGSGYIDGLGFYVDRWPRTRRTDLGQEEIGILAPFAYFKAVVVELDGLRVLGEESSHVARALYPPSAQSKTDPWNYLDPVEKVTALKGLSGEGLERMVPRVLGRL